MGLRLVSCIEVFLEWLSEVSGSIDREGGERLDYVSIACFFVLLSWSLEGWLVCFMNVVATASECISFTLLLKRIWGFQRVLPNV